MNIWGTHELVTLDMLQLHVDRVRDDRACQTAIPSATAALATQAVIFALCVDVCVQVCVFV